MQPEGDKPQTASAAPGATRLTFLGTGTSHGIPMIACHCPVCTSTDPRDRRNRCCLLVELPGGTFVIDTPPEFRLQCIAADVNRLDAILFTHTHADHVFGLDDVRRFCDHTREPIPVYASSSHLESLKRIFSYAFRELNEHYSERPSLQAVPIHEPFELLGRTVIPLDLRHGLDHVLGFKIDRWAYCTDCSAIPAASLEHLRDLDVLILDALRYTPHPTHFNLDQALAVVESLKPARAYLTHIAHEIRHADLQPRLPQGVFLSYDGLRITTAGLPAWGKML